MSIFGRLFAPPKSELHYYEFTFWTADSIPKVITRTVPVDKYDVLGHEQDTNLYAKWIADDIANRNGIWEDDVLYPYHQIKLVELKEVDGP